MTHRSEQMTLYSAWWAPPQRRSVDRKGVAVALAFLVAIALFAGGREDNAADEIPWHKQPDLSARIDFRHGVKLSGEAPAQVSYRPAIALRQDLEDPRQGQSIP